MEEAPGDDYEGDDQEQQLEEDEEDLDLTLADSQMPSMRIEVDEEIEGDEDEVDMPPQRPTRRRRL
jgi:hypothetical protein